MKACMLTMFIQLLVFAGFSQQNAEGIKVKQEFELSIPYQRRDC